VTLKGRHEGASFAFLAVAIAALVVGCSHGEKARTADTTEASGTTVVRLKAVPSRGHRVTSQDLDRSAEIMRKRLRVLGFPNPKVRIEGHNVLAIELPTRVGAWSLSLATKSPPLLEFYDFEAALTGPSLSGGFPVARPTVAALLGNNRSKPRGTVVVSCKVADGNCLSVQQVATRKAFYLFKNRPAITGADLDLSGTRADIDPQTSRPAVLMQFTQRGKRMFHEITRREAKRGAARCAGEIGDQAILRCAQHFAIVLDHQIVSLPFIDFVRNPDGIPGDNGVQIDMGGQGNTLADAKELALAVQTGALPLHWVRLP
jgi:preprotein translocase subunit SecD